MRRLNKFNLSQRIADKIKEIYNKKEYKFYILHLYFQF